MKDEQSETYQKVLEIRHKLRQDLKEKKIEMKRLEAQRNKALMMQKISTNNVSAAGGVGGPRRKGSSVMSLINPANIQVDFEEEEVEDRPPTTHIDDLKTEPEVNESEMGESNLNQAQQRPRLLELAEPREVTRLKKMEKKCESHTYDPEVVKLMSQQMPKKGQNQAINELNEMMGQAMMSVLSINNFSEKM